MVFMSTSATITIPTTVHTNMSPKKTRKRCIHLATGTFPLPQRRKLPLRQGRGKRREQQGNEIARLPSGPSQFTTYPAHSTEEVHHQAGIGLFRHATKPRRKHKSGRVRRE